MKMPTLRNGTASFICAVFVAMFTLPTSAGPAQTGGSGVVHMPDARVAPDGTLRLGLGHMDPYTALWSSITLLPRLEVSGRFTRIAGTQPFEDGDYGAHKDKAFDAKLLLFDERGWRPAVAVGVHDFVGDNQMFEAHYVVASRAIELGRFGTVDLSAGYGGGRIDGAFGGLRWHLPGSGHWRMILEWDGFDYAGDFYEMDRRGGLIYGAEYSRGWMGVQVTHRPDFWGANLHLAMPLQRRTFIPRVDEPAPVPVTAAAAPSVAVWQERPASLQALYRELATEGVGDVHLLVDGDTIRVAITESRMTMIGRAAGRAARVIAAHAPPDVTRLELTFTDFRLPLVTYRFDDLGMLRGYFAGTVDAQSLAQTVAVAYPDAGRHREVETAGYEWSDVFGPRDGRLLATTGHPVFGFPLTLRRATDNPGVLRIRPLRASFTFNDPNGVLKHDLYTGIGYTQWRGRRTYANASLRFTLHENISDTVGSSNSLLPRVRSDVGRYRREGERLRLQTLYLSHLMNPADRVYAWLSAGIVEEMFAAVGGEVLYLPEQGNWAVDGRAFAVRQRDFRGRLGFFDYEQVTALVSHHYRFPRVGVTFTTRAGRFLAGDHGARFEMRRRFASGFELGGWYTVTDARDITSPGTPENPYRDKGVFVRLALGPFLTRDNAAVVDFAVAPWARDPGQMLHAPGGLYELYERRLLLNLYEYGPWSDFGY